MGEAVRDPVLYEQASLREEEEVQVINLPGQKAVAQVIAEKDVQTV